MSILEDEADVFGHVINVRYLRTEVPSQDSLEDHHGEGVSCVCGDMPEGVDGAFQDVHVVCVGFGEEGGDGEGGGAAGVAEGVGVPADGVDEDEGQLEAVHHAHGALRVGSVEDDEIVAPS